MLTPRRIDASRNKSRLRGRVSESSTGAYACRSPLYLLILQGISQSRILKNWYATMIGNQNREAETRPRGMKEPVSQPMPVGCLDMHVYERGVALL